jgi:hypothetical protein
MSGTAGPLQTMNLWGMVTPDEALREIEKGSEFGLFAVCFLKRRKAGVDVKKAFRLALAERLGSIRREDWPRHAKLLELAGGLLVAECWPKLKAEWEAPNPQYDRKLINEFAELLKKQGVRAYRGEAEKMVAEQQGITVGGLRQRRYRKPELRRKTGSRRQRRPKKV